MFVKGKWPSKRRKDLESESLEMVYVEICLDKARKTIFAVVYKPASKNPENFKLQASSKMFLINRPMKRAKILLWVILTLTLLHQNLVNIHGI